MIIRLQCDVNIWSRGRGQGRFSHVKKEAAMSGLRRTRRTVLTPAQQKCLPPKLREKSPLAVCLPTAKDPPYVNPSGFGNQTEIKMTS